MNSKRGTQFRRWASQILKEHLLKGYTIDAQRISVTSLHHLQQAVDLFSKTLIHQELVNDMGAQVLEIMRNYTKTWDTLLRYDENRLLIAPSNSSISDGLTYEEALDAVHTFKQELWHSNKQQRFLAKKDKAPY